MTIHLDDKNQDLVKTWYDGSVSVADRGDLFLFRVCELGLDFRPAIQQLITDVDLLQKLREKLEALGENTLAAERFLGVTSQPTGRMYAMVTRGEADVCLPCLPEDVAEFQVGDPVLIDVKMDRIVGRDGSLPLAGDVVTVESIPPDKPGHVIVSHHDQRELARLHHSLIDQPEACKPGTQVVYDSRRRFVLTVVDAQTNGQELLMELDKLPVVRRSDVGSPNPVVDQIVGHFHDAVEHPEWLTQMGARDRRSYLFIGQTGGGKSYHLKLIAHELHELVEAYTGQRTSRMFMCDASQFWSPYFGETEQRINRWAEKVQNLGCRRLRGRDGRDVLLPLLGVIEECEALFRSRGESQSSGHLFDRVLSLLLQKFESIEGALRVPIVWICSTNRPDLVDSAALRRIGMRKICFGGLSASGAKSVLLKKISDQLPLRQADGRTNIQAREALVSKVIGYLYGPEPKQAMADVTFGNGQHRMLNRSDVVTPAILEEAISSGIDRCLTKSRQAGELLGLDADDVVAFLHRHFNSLAGIFTEHNIMEHCPEWFADDSVRVTNVKPVAQRRRRPVSLLT